MRTAPQRNVLPRLGMRRPPHHKPNAGTYHVGLPDYGGANAIVRAEYQIHPGKPLTEASVYQKGRPPPRLTLKLVSDQGGEANSPITAWGRRHPLRR